MTHIILGAKLSVTFATLVCSAPLGPQNSPPSAASPYAALRSGAGAPAPEPQGIAALFPSSSTPRYFVEEAEKLEGMKSALWSVLQSAPATGIPPQLIELVQTYTSTLRLQLSLMNYAPLPPRPPRVGAARVAGNLDRKP